MARRLRWLTILFGVATFLWLSVEDTQTLPVTILGTGLAFCGVGQWLQHQLRNQSAIGIQRIAVFGLSGGLVGLIAVLMITLLMFLKTAWHSHLYPDFPAPMMLAMLQLTLVWTLAGVLQGVGIGVIINDNPYKSPHPQPPAPLNGEGS